MWIQLFKSLFKNVAIVTIFLARISIFFPKETKAKNFFGIVKNKLEVKKDKVARQNQILFVECKYYYGLNLRIQHTFWND